MPWSVSERLLPWSWPEESSSKEKEEQEGRSWVLHVLKELTAVKYHKSSHVNNSYRFAKDFMAGLSGAVTEAIMEARWRYSGSSRG